MAHSSIMRITTLKYRATGSLLRIKMRIPEKTLTNKLLIINHLLFSKTNSQIHDKLVAYISSPGNRTVQEVP